MAFIVTLILCQRQCVSSAHASIRLCRLLNMCQRPPPARHTWRSEFGSSWKARLLWDIHQMAAFMSGSDRTAAPSEPADQRAQLLAWILILCCVFIAGFLCGSKGGVLTGLVRRMPHAGLSQWTWIQLMANTTSQAKALKWWAQRYHQPATTISAARTDGSRQGGEASRGITPVRECTPSCHVKPGDSCSPALLSALLPHQAPLLSATSASTLADRDLRIGAPAVTHSGQVIWWRRGGSLAALHRGMHTEPCCTSAQPAPPVHMLAKDDILPSGTQPNPRVRKGGLKENKPHWDSCLPPPVSTEPHQAHTVQTGHPPSRGGSIQSKAAGFVKPAGLQGHPAIQHGPNGTGSGCPSAHAPAIGSAGQQGQCGPGCGCTGTDAAVLSCAVQHGPLGPGSGWPAADAPAAASAGRPVVSLRGHFSLQVDVEALRSLEQALALVARLLGSSLATLSRLASALTSLASAITSATSALTKTLVDADLEAQRGLCRAAAGVGRAVAAATAAVCSARGGCLSSMHRRCAAASWRVGAWAWPRAGGGAWRFLGLLPGVAYIRCMVGEAALLALAALALLLAARHRGVWAGGPGHGSQGWLLDLLVWRGLGEAAAAAAVAHVLGGSWVTALLMWQMWCGLQLWLSARLLGVRGQAVLVLGVAVAAPLLAGTAPFSTPTLVLQYVWTWH